ncbi:peptidase inhibitor family I36 protein [Actinomadura xylanilytica]|uniref:peptidase inhibitor family I36 protein n=1 Tax=Actinomadura xylanilytica TaxID=887459 RepID=UPI00255ACB25|nr:peptidase inhibitor family I36 protein [Actinomadura xylanilytica]MDL4770914.1 peptidase inhibitor family I36 protein [Actinomadura xylanilytica]
MNRTRIGLTGAVVAGLAVVAAPASAMAAPAAAAQHQAAAAWQGSCAKGDFCVWSNKDGTGTKCAWDGDDPDWQGGDVQCRMNGLPFLVASYWNNGYTGAYSKVRIYSLNNYNETYYWGTLSAGQRNSVWEGQLMRSHKWVN